MTDLASISPKAYLVEEWKYRTWWGKTTLPFEALCLLIFKLMEKGHAKLPKVYKDGENDV